MPTCPRGHTSTADDYCDVCGRPIPAGPISAGPIPAGPIPAGPAQPAAPAAGTAGPVPPGQPEACPQCGTPRTGRFCELDGFDFMTATLHETPPPVRHPFSAPQGAPPQGAPPQGAPPQGGPPQGGPPQGGPPQGAPPQAAPPATAILTAVPPQPAAPPVSMRKDGAPPQPTPDAEPQQAAAAQVVVAADRAYFEIVRAAGGPDAGIIEFPDYCPDRRFPLRGSQLLIGRRSRSRGISPEIDLTGPPEDPGVSHAHALLLPHSDGGWAVVDLGSANGTYVNDTAKPIPVRVPVPVRPGDRIYAGAWTLLRLT